MRIIGIFPLKKAPSRENGVRFWTKVSSFCMAVAVRDRISTAGWAVLSGYVDHACGKLASGQLSTCHETVEPRWDCRGSDRGEPDIGSTVSPNSQSRGSDRIREGSDNEFRLSCLPHLWFRSLRDGAPRPSRSRPFPPMWQAGKLRFHFRAFETAMKPPFHKVGTPFGSATHLRLDPPPDA